MLPILLLLALDLTPKFRPRTVAEISKPRFRGMVYKPNGETVGQFESASIVVKGGTVYFKDPATGQLYQIPPEWIVVIVPIEPVVRVRR